MKHIKKFNNFLINEAFNPKLKSRGDSGRVSAMVNDPGKKRNSLYKLIRGSKKKAKYFTDLFKHVSSWEELRVEGGRLLLPLDAIPDENQWIYKMILKKNYQVMDLNVLLYNYGLKINKINTNAEDINFAVLDHFDKRLTFKLNDYIDKK